ncbi:MULTISPECIES: transposase [Acidobacterium]|uniref:Putative IS200 family transposase n=1 Tax=Acidobacterium capsulatum (strain ATCC 51196 / DSM 11244 / BCRC 80197 / JCM 7670 / NBRC 15755 / NCIMB 13165 / 161) TaxID=240015 RepID=C1F9W3_ACIC5|nr:MULTISPECIES: transposase [Acidobacterium]ACO33966.1 putative IS200 family transposase [Acidobacterium capsulatum ATCC 51196]HCT61706.1 hypothetical protein [Acidobacterium sp.]
MPTGVQRFHHSGHTHFITFSCRHRRSNFSDATTRSIFEAARERIRRDYLLCIYGYVVMPDHVHLLLTAPRRQTLADCARSSMTPLKQKRLEWATRQGAGAKAQFSSVAFWHG